MNEKMRILIAYDGSDGANAALDDLRRAGLSRTAEALVVSVPNCGCHRRRRATRAWTPLSRCTSPRV